MGPGGELEYQFIATGRASRGQIKYNLDTIICDDAFSFHLLPQAFSVQKERGGRMRYCYSGSSIDGEEGPPHVFLMMTLLNFDHPGKRSIIHKRETDPVYFHANYN